MGLINGKKNKIIIIKWGVIPQLLLFLEKSPFHSPCLAVNLWPISIPVTSWLWVQQASCNYKITAILIYLPTIVTVVITIVTLFTNSMYCSELDCKKGKLLSFILKRFTEFIHNLDDLLVWVSVLIWFFFFFSVWVQSVSTGEVQVPVRTQWWVLGQTDNTFSHTGKKKQKQQKKNNPG